MSLGLAVVMMAIGLSSNLLFADWTCAVSANPDENNGHCRANNAGTGDGCYSVGYEPACSGSYYEGDPFEEDDRPKFQE